jgi:hypothetical protein
MSSTLIALFLELEVLGYSTGEIPKALGIDRTILQGPDASQEAKALAAIDVLWDCAHDPYRLTAYELQRINSKRKANVMGTRYGAKNMRSLKLIELINKIPYLLFVTSVPLVIFSCAALLSGVRHTDNWWLVIVVPLLASLSSLIIGILKLCTRGLHYSATMGDLNESLNKTRKRLP